MLDHPKFGRISFFMTKKIYICSPFGGLAQLARALAWHARGHRFDSDILHTHYQGFTEFCKAFFLSGNTQVTQK